MKYWNITKIINFEIEDTLYAADVIVKMYNDPNYGVDVDGNRGISQDNIDEVTIEEVRDISEDKPVVIGVTTKIEAIINSKVEDEDLKEYK